MAKKTGKVAATVKPGKKAPAAPAAVAPKASAPIQQAVRPPATLDHSLLVDAAMAAESAEGGKPGELSAATLKSFRHQPEMENFYRFIYENDLRYEALAIMNDLVIEKANRRQLKAKAKSKH